MKNIIRIVTLTVVVGFLSTTFLSAQEHNHQHKSVRNKTAEMMQKMNKMKKIDKNKDGFVYECPMKCEAPQDTPGECSKCGMKLQKMSIKDMDKKMMNKGKMMKNKMNHEKMKNNKNMMHDNIKAKGMDNMKMEGKQKMKTLELK